MSEPHKMSVFRIKGLLPALALVLFGAVLIFVSNLVLTDRTNTAVQNAQTQAQTVKESSLCQEEPEKEEACVQSEQILNNPTSRDVVPGPQGISGAQGVTGNTGARGADGLVGPIGPAGPVGPTGPQGLIGPKGDQGINGLAGIQGLQGFAGFAGEVGATGLQGEAGPAGPIGPAGEKGDPGEPGAPGSEGPQGVTGIDGIYPVDVYVDCAAGVVTVTMSDRSTIGGIANCAIPTPPPVVVPEPEPTSP